MKYGWKPSLPDFRDLKVEHISTANLPKIVDFRPVMPKPYDQGSLGSCTGNAWSGAVEYDRIKQGLVDFTPSRLYIYYKERSIEGTVKQDSGAMVRDGAKALNKYGAPNEKSWPYDITKFAKKPTTKIDKEAKTHLIDNYKAVPQTLDALKSVLASGYPIVFGFTVYESFESDEVAKTGIVPMPKNSENVLGGHAVLICGYNDDTKQFIVRNSWGESWGLKGYFLMPYEYVTNPNLASDFWVVNHTN